MKIKKNLISVRIDDVSEFMDRTKFLALMDDLEKRNIKGMLGIIPHCCDEKLIQETENLEFWNQIKKYKEEGWILAMHGVNHVYDINARSLVSNSLKSEFAGHPYGFQFEKLKKGVEILKQHGIETNVFFAPGHSYDKNTILALKNLGFRYVSDGRSNYVYERWGMKFVPCKIYGCPKKAKGHITLALHPCAVSIPYKWPVDFIDKNRAKVCDYKDLMEQEAKNNLYNIIYEMFYVIWVRHFQQILWKIIQTKNNLLKKERIR